MSGHADTIRAALVAPMPGGWGANDPEVALNELVAENQRLREALEAERAQRKWAFEQLRMWWRGVHRDGDSAAAIEELYRVEKALR